MSHADTSIDGVIRDGRHHMQVRVYYEDTDFSGIVYHANYLRFMERGRTNYLRLIGADHGALFAAAQAQAAGLAFVVRAMQIEFLKSARMDDVLDVVTAPQEVKGASIMLRQRVMRGGETLVERACRQETPQQVAEWNTAGGPGQCACHRAPDNPRNLTCNGSELVPEVGGVTAEELVCAFSTQNHANYRLINKTMHSSLYLNLCGITDREYNKSGSFLLQINIDFILSHIYSMSAK